MNIVDSHFHSLTMAEKGVDFNSACDFLYKGIDIGTVCDDLPQRAELLGKHRNILLSAAMGPWCTDNATEDELEVQLSILKTNIAKFNPFFIGEIGLDYYWHYGTDELQNRLFREQLKLACTLHKRVLIHARDAEADIISAIHDCAPEEKGVIHCFSGSKSFLYKALDEGFYISYAGNITFKANDGLRSTLKCVPKERLLLETDSPYLAPVPLRGKPNSPEYIIHIYNYVASLLGIHTEELAETVACNFADFIKSGEQLTAF